MQIMMFTLSLFLNHHDVYSGRSAACSMIRSCAQIIISHVQANQNISTGYCDYEDDVMDALDEDPATKVFNKCQRYMNILICNDVFIHLFRNRFMAHMLA